VPNNGKTIFEKIIEILHGTQRIIFQYVTATRENKTIFMQEIFSF